jgi:cytoskeleton protein RodZ
VDKADMTPEINRNNHKPEDQEVPLGIGAFLKAEREKKGYTLDQMASEIRLRTYLLEAIENENWEQLPAPVFVKGFIRSYARVLDLNDEDIVNQYDRIGELKEPLPQPLTKPIRSHRAPIILVILVLAVIAAIIFLWYSFKTQDITPGKPEQIPESEIHKTMTEKSQLEEATPTKLELTMEMDSIGGVGAEDTKEKSPRIDREKEEQEQPQQAETVIESKPKPETPYPEQVNINYTLRARILEETYVRITIDDKDPKEYIFQPDSRPRWEAENGFEVLVGNAAGVEFEFEDRQYQNLGRRGQVVRLRFPEGFTANIPEE